jgi:hypothetical protein
MKKIIPLIIALNFFAAYCIAQVYIGPIIGYQIDLNNKKRLNQINSAIQFDWKVSKYYGMIFQLQKGWPLPYISSDSSFSSNPALPVYASAKKTIRPSAISFAIGHRIMVKGKNSANIFSFIAYTGLTAQKIAVSYSYDKNNYTILNPDQTKKRISGFLSAGVEYMHLLKNGRFFTQLIFSTPPVGKKIKYPSSFNFLVPLSFNAGYSIPLKKK